MTEYIITCTNWQYNVRNPTYSFDTLKDALKNAVGKSSMYKGIEISVPVSPYKWKRIGTVYAIRTGIETPNRYIYITDKGIRELTKSGNYRK